MSPLTFSVSEVGTTGRGTPRPVLFRAPKTQSRSTATCGTLNLRSDGNRATRQKKYWYPPPTTNHRLASTGECGDSASRRRAARCWRPRWPRGCHLHWAASTRSPAGAARSPRSSRSSPSSDKCAMPCRPRPAPGQSVSHKASSRARRKRSKTNTPSPLMWGNCFVASFFSPDRRQSALSGPARLCGQRAHHRLPARPGHQGIRPLANPERHAA